MTQVGIIYKHRFEPARREAERAGEWLRGRGVTVYSEEMQTDSRDTCPASKTSIPETVDWIIVLGGDGTLLGVARAIGTYGIPILGVNLGGLGFLTSIPLEKLYSSLDKALRGELEIESRAMLETKVIRNQEEVCCFRVLNDVVINKGALARIIDLEVFINSQFLTVFRADGLIIATPTGSTAYNLSAGGPILYPTMESCILTPICPFTLTNRPIILPDSHRIAIRMGKESEEKVSLTLDGQVGFDFFYGDTVLIQKAKEKIRLVKSLDKTYFEILRTKLMWGETAYSREMKREEP